MPKPQPPEQNILIIPPLYYDLSYTKYIELGCWGDVIVIKINPHTGKIVIEKKPHPPLLKDMNILLSTVNLLTTSPEAIHVDMRVHLEKLASSTAMTIVNTAMERPDPNPSVK